MVTMQKNFNLEGWLLIIHPEAMHMVAGKGENPWPLALSDNPSARFKWIIYVK